MNELPLEVIYWHIAKDLSPISLARFSATCSVFYNLFKNDTRFQTWKKNTQTESVEKCLWLAAEEGDRELVDLFIDKGATNWNSGLRGASVGGHRELVDLFIAKGATNWNWALECASGGGHRELVDFFREKIRENS